MRLDYVKSASIGHTLGQFRAIEVEMEYLPDCSKNEYKLRNGAIKRQVREWMECLTFMVRSLKNSQGVEFTVPLTVRIDGMFLDRNRMPDLHNFMIVTCDAIEEALGINDRDYKTETGYPEVGDEAKIIITIRSEVKDD